MWTIIQAIFVAVPLTILSLMPFGIISYLLEAIGFDKKIGAVIAGISSLFILGYVVQNTNFLNHFELTIFISVLAHFYIVYLFLSDE